jgi:hypothetical protein
VIVRFLPDEVEGISGDLVIATDMWTTFPASQMTMMKERFYLVQDYEALFHTHGTFTYVADMTYRMGFKVVCAGAWLKSVCEGKYGLWTRAWELAYDPLYYYRGEGPRVDHDPVRIAFYARASTPRRAVELGREALLILHDRGCGSGSICLVRMIWARRHPMNMSTMACSARRNWATFIVRPTLAWCFRPAITR